MKNYDFIVQERQPEFDRDCLHRKLFAVNMRLYKSSPKYKRLILDVVEYMRWLMGQRWEDYQSNPAGGTYGISGANIGIGHNIIGYMINDKFVVMINPEIVHKSKELVTAQSNCGSIKLDEKIPIKRHKWIDVRYYDIYGSPHEGRFDRTNGGFTIQHEIDHNNGILITDRHQEQTGSSDWLSADIED